MGWPGAGRQGAFCMPAARINLPPSKRWPHQGPLSADASIKSTLTPGSGDLCQPIPDKRAFWLGLLRGQSAWGICICVRVCIGAGVCVGGKGGGVQSFSPPPSPFPVKTPIPRLIWFCYRVVSTATPWPAPKSHSLSSFSISLIFFRWRRISSLRRRHKSSPKERMTGVHTCAFIG